MCPFMFDNDLGENEFGYSGEEKKKIEMQNSWQKVKHPKLYSDLL